jgi:hypothetical protein
MYQIISLVLAALGVILFIAPDYLLKDVQDSKLKMIKDYHQVVGAGLGGVAYYLYSTSQKTTGDTLSTPTTPSTPSETIDLPSYEQATSE